METWVVFFLNEINISYYGTEESKRQLNSEGPKCGGTDWEEDNTYWFSYMKPISCGRG